MSTAPSPNSGIHMSSRITMLLEQVRATCTAIEADPTASEPLRRMQELRDECADAILGLSTKQKGGAEADAACALVDIFVQSGLLDEPASGETLARANDVCRMGWSGLLGSLLLAPAWQLRTAPRIEDTPMWMWSVYAACVLHLPRLLRVPGQADQMAVHYAQRLREVIRLAEANFGSASVKAVIERFVAAGDCAILGNSSGSLREVQSLRGRLTSAINGAGRGEDVFLLPRDGRRLKVGFVLESIADSPQVRDALRWIEHMDERRFEVVLFTLKPAFTELATALTSKVGESKLVGDDRAEAIVSLRNSLLDVAVFFTRTMRAGDLVSAIASHRTAPVQVVIDETRFTSGLPNADLALLEDGANPAKEALHYTERLAVMPGTGVPFAASLARSASTAEWSREGLGISAESVVYGTIAPFGEMTPEWIGAMADVLTAVPNSRLLLYSYDTEDQGDAALGRLCSLVEPALVLRGISQDRLIISNERFPSIAEVIALLRVVDVFVDTWPMSQREPVMLAFEAGVPVITCTAGLGHPRHAAAMLASLGITESIAPDLPALTKAASSLGADAKSLGNLKAGLAAALARPETTFDPIAFSDAFGLMLELAFDEALGRGQPGFESGAQPLSVVLGEDVETILAEVNVLLDSGLAPEASSRIAKAAGSHPTNPAVRRMLQKVLSAQGRHERAAESLLSAVERQSDSGELWFELGQSLRAAGKRADAVKAYEVALRLVPSNLDGWLVLAELAVESENHDLLRQISSVAAQLAPDDSRVRDLLSRL